MRKIRVFLATALILATFIGATTPVLASEVILGAGEKATSDLDVKVDAGGEINLLSTDSYAVGNSYTTVAYNRYGIGRDIAISIDQEGYNGWEYQMNIIMIDTAGRVVWRADNVTGVAADGHWWAGPNVARVQLQIAPRYWFVPSRYFRVKCIF